MVYYSLFEFRTCMCFLDTFISFLPRFLCLYPDSYSLICTNWLHQVIVEEKPKKGTVTKNQFFFFFFQYWCGNTICPISCPRTRVRSNRMRMVKRWKYALLYARFIHDVETEPRGLIFPFSKRSLAVLASTFISLVSWSMLSCVSIAGQWLNCTLVDFVERAVK